jgi:hypothetical protein
MMVGLATKNSWWPMNRASQAVNKFVGNLNEQLSGAFTNAEDIVKRIAQAKDWSDEQLTKARQDIDNIRDTTLSNLQTLAQNAPADQRLQLAAATVDRSLSFLESKYPDLERTTLVAGQSIDIAADFVATIKDNPGRRLISICAGAVLGLIVAWLLGLDTFQAAMAGTGQSASAAPSSLKWGDALTGLLMGRGSAPARGHKASAVSEGQPQDREHYTLDRRLTMGQIPSFDALKLYNDWKFRQKADELDRER